MQRLLRGDTKPMVGPLYRSGQGHRYESFIVALNNSADAPEHRTNFSEPETGKIYGPDFPVVTVRDCVKSQACCPITSALRNGLLWLVAVSSMQVLRWAISFFAMPSYCGCRNCPPKTLPSTKWPGDYYRPQFLQWALP